MIFDELQVIRDREGYGQEFSSIVVLSECSAVVQHWTSSKSLVFLRLNSWTTKGIAFEN